MSRIEVIKKQFHTLIDQAEDETVLTHFYDAFAASVEAREGSFWDGLSAEQQASMKESYEESKQPEKLIPNVDVWKKYDKWITR